MQDDKKKILIALKKARSSLDRIISEVESTDDNHENSRCFDIIQQSLSVIGLLKNANNQILKRHIDSYIDSYVKNISGKGGCITKEELENMKEEIIKIVQTAQNK